MLSILGHFISIMALEQGLKIVKILEDGNHFFSCLLQKVATLRAQDCFANMEIEVTFETVYEQFSVSFVSTYILCEFVKKRGSNLTINLQKKMSEKTKKWGIFVTCQVCM